VALLNVEGKQLKDIDTSNEKDQEFTKINTLGHYGIKGGCQFIFFFFLASRIITNQ